MSAKSVTEVWLDEKIENIVKRHAENRMSNVDDFVARFLNETKLNPSECELVEFRKSVTETVWFCRKKEEIKE